jgi:hypothetical protein
MKNHLWLALFAFIFMTAIANGQMYTYHDAWFDANGNVVVDNATQGSGGYGKTSYAYAHIQMPSGAVSSNTASGNAYAEAVTQKSTFGEVGQGALLRLQRGQRLLLGHERLLRFPRTHRSTSLSGRTNSNSFSEPGNMSRGKSWLG